MRDLRLPERSQCLRLGVSCVSSCRSLGIVKLTDDETGACQLSVRSSNTGVCCGIDTYSATNGNHGHLSCRESTLQVFMLVGDLSCFRYRRLGVVVGSWHFRLAIGCLLLDVMDAILSPRRHVEESLVDRLLSMPFPPASRPRSKIQVRG
jgi:hypothetical protein